MSARAKPWLRDRLVRHVAVPLVLTCALGNGIALGVANHFAGQAFDRSLLDDAYALSAHIRLGPEGAQLKLSQAELSTLLFDQTESLYFAVIAADGRLVAGHTALRPPEPPEGTPYQFADLLYQGREVRTVSLRRSDPAEVLVVMGQTTASRSQLLHRLLLYSAAPQILLLLLLGWWLRRAIALDLQPLAQLHRSVNQRDAGDLSAVPQAVTGASTRDVEQLGTALNSMLSRLARSIAAQREFAGNVAHELRTPLAGIRAQVGYALARTDPLVWREQLLGIGQGEQRASHLVDQLLALALADEAQAALRLQPVELDRLVQAVVLRFMPRADAAAVDLGAEGLEERLVVNGDPALIEGIVSNLVDNALRYATAERPHVTVALAREQGCAVLKVIDNGPGLDAAEMQRVGQRWAQGEAGQKLGKGAGLGLAIVRRYAELLGARFSLDPGPGGQGLCASVCFASP